MSCTSLTAVPEAPQAKQWKTPLAALTDMDARRSPWMGQQTISLPQRPSWRATP